MYLYHDSILMKHMLKFVEFTPKCLGQVASDSNGGLRYVDNIFKFKKLCLFRVTPPTIFFVPTMPTLVHFIPIF
jgi:hypothetical protein